MNEDKRTFLARRRDPLVFWKHWVLVSFEDQHALRAVRIRPVVQWVPDHVLGHGGHLLVGARDVPEATVLQGRVVDGEPVADQLQRVVAQERPVLVGSDWGEKSI